MANCSDAFGTFTIEKVGKEFIKFLDEVQGTEEKAYYKLVEIDNFNDIVPNSNGDVEFDFSTMGRWNYGANLEGYLDGKWMERDDATKKAYAKLIKAIKKKNGVITCEYTDSDTSMDWMGQGIATLEVIEGVVQYSENFNEESLDIEKYAKMNGYDINSAFELMHGDEPAEKWGEYVAQCKKEGKKPKNPQSWYDEDFEWEE